MVNADARRMQRSVPVELLSRRDFRNVWFAGSIAGIMRWLDLVAVGVYVLAETGSALYVAMALFLRMLPMLLFGAFTGAFAEIVDRKRLLECGLLALATVYAIMGYLAFTDQLELWQLGIGVFLSGVFWATELPVRRTLIGEIAGIEHVGAAMALDSSTNNLTRMLGPTMGGFLLEFVGLHGAFWIGTTLYLVGAFLLTRVAHPTRPQVGVRPAIFANIAEGLRYIRGQRIIMAALVVTLFLNLFGFSYTSMIPVIAREELGLSAFPTGLLMSAEGAGAFCGAMLVAFFGKATRFRQFFFFGALVYLACIFTFSFSTLFALSAPILFAGGFGAAGFATMQSVLLITATPPEMRNRVMGVMAVSIGFGPIGILHVGLLANWLTAATAVSIIAVEGLICIGVAGLIWPEIRRRSEPQ